MHRYNRIVNRINNGYTLTAATMIAKHYNIKDTLANRVASMCRVLGKQIDEAIDIVVSNDYGNCFAEEV